VRFDSSSDLLIILQTVGPLQTNVMVVLLSYVVLSVIGMYEILSRHFL
jgi:hypothetical protein